MSTTPEDETTSALAGQAAWSWARWDAGTSALSPVEGLEPSTLIELTEEGGPRRALAAPGVLHGMARIR